MKKRGLLVMLALWFTNASTQTTDSVVFIEPQSSSEVVTLETYPQRQKKERQLPLAALKLDAGYGWRLVEISDELNAYQKDFFSHLMSGFVWDASLDFFLNDMFGIRMTFYQYRASHSDFARDLDTGKQGILDAKDVITYLGPAFVFRLPFAQNSWIFNANAGMGYIEYRGKQTFVNEDAKFYGATVGVQMGAGLEYRILPQLGAGVNMQITSGQILSFDYEKNGVKSTETYEIGEGEGLLQVKLGVGIRYYIK
jgi:hypothetical protein